MPAQKCLVNLGYFPDLGGVYIRIVRGGVGGALWTVPFHEFPFKVNLWRGELGRNYVLFWRAYGEFSHLLGCRKIFVLCKYF